LSAPPHDLTAERYLVGAVLRSEGARDIALAEIVAGDLFAPDHRTVWAAAGSLAASGAPVDALGVHAHLRQAGGAESAAQLVLDVDSTMAFVSLDAVEQRCKRVRDLAAVRKVLAAARGLALEVADEGVGDPSEWLDRAEQFITEAAEHRGDDGQMFTAREVMAECMSHFVARAERGGAPDGHMSGLVEVDSKLGGFAPGRLYVFAGRPGSGKSVLSKDVGLGLVTSTGWPALFVSLEMPKKELGDRMICSEAGVLYEDWRTARVTPDELQAVGKASKSIAEMPLYFIDKPRAAVEHVTRWGRRLKRRTGKLATVVVDYLQLLTTTKRNYSREQDVAHVSQSLKALAKELECPVIACAQLNRAADARQDKRPLLSELRESGSIEQDADAVCLMYRDDYYHPESERKGVVEVNVAKHRAGPTGVAELSFQGKYVRIANLETYHEPEPDYARGPEW